MTEISDTQTVKKFSPIPTYILVGLIILIDIVIVLDLLPSSNNESIVSGGPRGDYAIVGMLYISILSLIALRQVIVALFYKNYRQCKPWLRAVVATGIVTVLTWLMLILLLKFA